MTLVVDGEQPSRIDDVEWLADVRPTQPIMLVAFEGWNDAGDAATQAVDFLRRRSRSQPMARVNAEPYFDFTTARPRIEIDLDGERRIQWPDSTLYAGSLGGSGTDVVFLLGVEPQLRWRSFCSRVVEVAKHLDASLVVSLGALLADVPHSRPVEIYGSADDVELAEELALTPSTYEGPTGIVGVLQHACRDAGLRSASLWAAVPSYVPGASSPKAALALISRLQELIGFSLSTTELEIAAASYERQVSELVEEDDDTLAYVRELEQHYDDDERLADDILDLPGLDSDGPVAAAALVEEVERFLREQPG